MFTTANGFYLGFQDTTGEVAYHFSTRVIAPKLNSKNHQLRHVRSYTENIVYVSLSIGSRFLCETINSAKLDHKYRRAGWEGVIYSNVWEDY